MTTLEPVGGVPHTVVGAGMVVHAHYYGAAFSRAVAGTGTLDGRNILYSSAAIAALRAFGLPLRGHDLGEAVHAAVDGAGLGVVRGVETCEGRVVIDFAVSHHASARQELFGAAAAPVCDLVGGVLAGALQAATGSGYAVEEVECAAAGGAVCRFIARPTKVLLELPAYRQSSGTRAREVLPLRRAGEPGNEVDRLTSKVCPPGATYGRLPAELYVRAARDFALHLPRRMGRKFGNLASVVLVEAAHVGVFHAVTRLLRSPEWSNIVRPELASRCDPLEALVSLARNMGWGEWNVALSVPDQRFTVHIRSGYEALADLALGTQAAESSCFFARGAVAALVNAVWVGDSRGSSTPDQSLYNAVCRSPLSFRTIETRCVAQGDPYCEIVANPLSSRRRLA